MATKYIYREKEFKSLYAVRQYIGIEERIGFGEAETVEDFRRFGFDVISREYDPEQEYYASLTELQKTQYDLRKAKRVREEAVKGDRKWPEKLIDFIFFWQPGHCKRAYESELNRTQLPPSMRQRSSR